MTELTWEEPPVKGRNRNDWNTIAASLKANPNKWAVVAENVSASTGTHIRHGRLTAFAPEGTFEARVSGAKADNGGRAEKIYARYVGTASTSSAPTETVTASPLDSVTASARYESLPEPSPTAIVGSVVPPLPEHLQQVNRLSDLLTEDDA
jgi:hypothetical protein